MGNHFTQSSNHGQSVTIAVAVLSVDALAGETFPVHVHNHGQLIYAIKGVVVVRAPEGNWIVPSGRAVWLPSMTAHAVSAATDVHIRSVFIDPKANQTLPDTCTVIEVSPLLQALIVAGASITGQYTAQSREQRIMDLIIDEIVLAPTLEHHLPMPKHPGLIKLCSAFIHQPAQLATIAEWACAMHMNERTFARLFKSETGMTMGAWLRQTRLLLSLTALSQGVSVIRVALEHGYESPSAFTAAFRRTFHMLPSDYSNKHNRFKQS
jgi:AraC-like DNA-binding protein